MKALSLVILIFFLVGGGLLLSRQGSVSFPTAMIVIAVGVLIIGAYALRQMRKNA